MTEEQPSEDDVRIRGCACSEYTKNESKCMQTCMNCRMAVEASLTRVGGRKLRRLRNLPECSIDRCAEFLMTVRDVKIRLHLASMAWWRFSSDTEDGKAEKVHRVMAACGRGIPDFGKQYLHDALKILSPLSQEQLSSWFGYNNVYQIAELFTGGIEEQYGRNCAKCALFKAGCERSTHITANECDLWKDKFLQDVTKAVKKSEGWRDPCKGLTDDME